MNAASNNDNFIRDNTVIKIGFWSGIVAFTAAIMFGMVQLLQMLGVVQYPLDEVLIYSCSLCITVPFMIEMLALHHITDPGKKFWSHTAVAFTLIYVVFVVANYVVQLATVIPMSEKGLSREVGMLRQTPHSMFWDFDAIGYIAMGFAMLFAVPIFENRGFQKRVKFVLLVHSATTPLIAFIYFYPNFSNNLLILATPWAITAPLSMLMLSLMFRKLQTH